MSTSEPSSNSSSTLAEKWKLGGPAGYGSYAVEKRIGRLDRSLSLAGMRVLDLGCGNGCYTQELSSRAGSVVGLDFQMSNLQAFRQAISRVQGIAENLPFSSESFDVVTIIEVLEHTHSDVRVMHECFRVLRPQGRLVVFAPNKVYPFESHPCHLGRVPIGPNIPIVSWLPDWLHSRFCYARIYTRSRLVAIARTAGFEPEEIGYIFPPLDSFPAPFKNAYRRTAWILEKTWLGIFGVSIFAVLKRP